MNEPFCSKCGGPGSHYPWNYCHRCWEIWYAENSENLKYAARHFNGPLKTWDKPLTDKELDALYEDDKRALK